MPNQKDLQSAVARRADTPKSKISVADTSRVLKALEQTLTEEPELIPVVERMLCKARYKSAD